MNIQINTHLANTLVSLNESIRPFFTEQQKKIMLIVSIIFAALATLATCYMIYRNRCVESENEDPFYNVQKAEDPTQSPDLDPVEDLAKIENENEHAEYPDRKSLQDRSYDAKGRPVAVAKNITLREFRDLNSDNQEFMVDEYQVQSTIDSIGGADFFQKIKHVKDEVLDLVTMSDLTADPQTSKLKYVLLSEEEFKNVSLKEAGEATDEQVQFIFLRLKCVDVETQKNFISPQNKQEMLDLGVIHFQHLSTKKNTFILAIPPNLFYYLLDSQIKDLDFSIASKEQIDCLFSAKRSREEDQKRFALLSSEQAHKVLDHLNQYQMSLLTDEHLKELDLGKFCVRHLLLLFPERLNEKEYQNDRRRFALFSPNQVKTYLERLSNPLQTLFVTDEQVKQVNECMIPLLSDEHLMQLNVATLSDDQVHTLSSDKLSREENLRRFALFSNDQINLMFDKFDSDQLNLLSDEQLMHLNFSSRRLQKLKSLFCQKIDYKENQRRFALFSKNQFKEICNNHCLSDPYLLSLISESQMKLFLHDHKRFTYINDDLLWKELDRRARKDK